MILQKKVSGNYVNVTTVFDSWLSIPAKGLLKLDSGKDNLGNQVFAGWNNLNVVPGTTGDYRVYARFESSGKVVSDNWEFRVK